jgi:hypothetical protein
MADYTAFDYSGLGETIAGLPRSVNLPTGVLQSGMMSTTSVAGDCFAKQMFSSKLQAFLVGYVNSIYSDYAVYD